MSKEVIKMKLNVVLHVFGAKNKDTRIASKGLFRVINKSTIFHVLNFIAKVNNKDTS